MRFLHGPLAVAIGLGGLPLSYLGLAARPPLVETPGFRWVVVVLALLGWLSLISGRPRVKSLSLLGAGGTGAVYAAANGASCWGFLVLAGAGAAIFALGGRGAPARRFSVPKTSRGRGGK